jgi:NAD kinase
MSEVAFAIIVKNKTRLELLNERFNTRSQAQFYIERQGGSFGDYVQEHERFHDSLSQVQRRLSQVVKSKLIGRDMLPNYIFASNNIVVVVGQDGLVANTAKYVNELPIIAVNPDAARYDGVLLPFSAENFLPGRSRAERRSAPLSLQRPLHRRSLARIGALPDCFRQ